MIVCLEWIGLSAEQVSLHVALANLIKVCMYNNYNNY